MKLNPNWCLAMERKVASGEIDETLSITVAKQWLIEYLSKQGILFSVTHLGAGVTRITTRAVSHCPMCKQRITK